MPTVTSSISPLAGAREINATHLVFSYEDLAGKIANLISGHNAILSAMTSYATSISALNVEVSALISFVSAAVTASQVSGLSHVATAPVSLAALLTSYGVLSNFKV